MTLVPWAGTEKEPINKDPFIRWTGRIFAVAFLSLILFAMGAAIWRWIL